MKRKSVHFAAPSSGVIFCYDGVGRENGYRIFIAEGIRSKGRGMIYAFGDYELDLLRYELRYQGGLCKLEPQEFSILTFLIEHRDRVVTKEELFEQVWPDQFVSEATLSQRIMTIRKALGESGRTPRCIKTIHGRGYRFTGEVEASRSEPVSHMGASPGDNALVTSAFPSNQVDRPALSEGPNPNRNIQPSLMILPFKTFGNDPELEGVADGLVENLTTILTRVPLLSLTSRSSSFALKGKAITADDIRRLFGVRYMLEGSIQETAGSVRTNVQLIETETGFHLWAQQFDRARELNLMPNLLHDILPRLEPQLVRAMFNDFQSNSSDESSSKQLLLHAMSLLVLKGWHETTFTKASDLLRRAIKLEPSLALSHALLAFTCGFGHRVGLMRESDAVVREAVQEAELALELDSMDSYVLVWSGCALADVGQTSRAIPLLKKAISINPNNAQAWVSLGTTYMIEERFTEAVEQLVHGIEISPMDSRLSIWTAMLGLAYIHTGELEKALQAALVGCEAHDTTYLPRVVLTAVYMLRGETEEAAKALHESYRVKPDLSEPEIESLIGRELGRAWKQLSSQLQPGRSSSADLF